MVFKLFKIAHLDNSFTWKGQENEDIPKFLNAKFNSRENHIVRCRRNGTTASDLGSVLLV